MTIRAGLIGTHKWSNYLQIYEHPYEKQIYWNKCYCNEYDALRRRHILGNIPQFVPNNEPLKLLEREALTNMSLFKPFSRVSHKIFLDNTRTTIKSRYKRAFYNINQNRIHYNPLISRINCFVKYEKIPIGKMEERKPPRCIQFRSYEYLYWLKRELLDFDLQVKNTDKKWNDQTVPSIFTKTSNNYGIARKLRDSWEMFTCPIALCLDHSKFDGHYNENLLNIEHKCWKKLNKSRLLSLMLKDQLRNKGTTQNGIKYKCKGTRASGESTTSTANSFMNYAMLATWVKAAGITKFRIHVNGDDSVVIIESVDNGKLLPLSYFNNFNMETEMDRAVMDFRQISYCQSSPVRVLVDDKLMWYMVKTPERAIARLSYCDSKFSSCLERYRLGIGLCELAVNSGVPMLQSFSLKLINDGKKAKPLGSVDKMPARTSGNDSSVRNIPLETRLDFEKAFNITVEQQVDFERFHAGEIISDPEIIAKLTKYKRFTQN